MSLTPLNEWAKSLMGEYAPCSATLLRWRKSGKIQPPPVKIGRAYFVSPDAVYTERSRSLLDRIHADEAKAHAR